MNCTLSLRYLACFLLTFSVSLASRANQSSESPHSIPSYSEFNENEFLTEWICLDRIVADKGAASLKEAFNKEPLTPQELWNSVADGSVILNGKSYKWNPIHATGSTIDFNEHLGSGKNIYTYAILKIDSTEARKLTLGVGSDDAIKLWLNGELIHTKWTFRGVTKDQDLVPIKLVQGSNRLIVKVASSTGSWGLSIRPLSVEKANLRFASLIGGMNLKTLDELLAVGLDINAKSSLDLTGLQKARLAGLTIRPAQLIKRGADPNIELPGYQPFISGLFKRAVNPDSAGIAYLVAKDGNIIAKDGLGMANIENDISITTKSKFRIASATKPFTAAAILLLQERGLLSIEDSLSKYIPAFPKGNIVTLRQLLNHTSGIHDYMSGRFFLRKVTSPVDPLFLIKEIKGYRYDFEPGTNWSYSNSGFYLLGTIVEIVSGQSLARFWSENIFAPLGMNDTGVYEDGNGYENEALGYSREQSKTQRAINWDMSWAGGACNIYSTVEDLFLWNEAFHNGKVISAKSYRDATTPAKLSNGDEAQAMGAHYGLGLMLGKIRGRRVISHSGIIEGFRADLIRLPAENLTFVTLSNSWPSALRFGRDPFYLIGSMIIGLDPIANDIFSTKKSSSVAFEDYIGEYNYSGRINIVSYKDDRFFVQLPNQPKFEFFHSSGDTFYFPGGAQEIVFARDESGNITEMTFIKIGRVITQKKINRDIPSK